MSESVDLAGGVAGPETVVDINDGDTTATAVEHAQQGGDASEACAIANAGGYGDYGAVDKSGHDAGQGAFHAGHYHEDIGLEEVGMAAENSMKSGYSNIEDALDLIAHDIGGDGGFFSDGYVTGPGAEDGDSSLPFWERLFLEGETAGCLVVGGMFWEALA